MMTPRAVQYIGEKYVNDIQKGEIYLSQNVTSLLTTVQSITSLQP